MDADSSTEAMAGVDPVQAFATRLRRLQVDSGGPSVRDLVRLTDKIGSPYTRGTIQDKLAGRSVAPWEFVQAFVQACALHTGTSAEPDLRPWREWHAQMAREVAALRTGRRRVTKTKVCPYRGLEAFTAEHAEWFHGRAAAVHHVLTALAAHRRGVLLLGPSGAGKSSLIQAGVLPALAAGQLPSSDRWITVLARPGKDLLGELDRAGLPGADSEPIASAVERRLANQLGASRLLLVIDQFEELLTPISGEQDSAEREAIDQLTAAIGASALSVVLVLRDDFYPRLASQAPELLEKLTPGSVNVSATLDAQELRDIITQPAEAVGLDCQDGLPERIINDVLAADPATTPARHAPVTVLPLLELTLHQLWERRRGTTLTHDAYQRIGEVTGALATWCDTAIAQLPADQRPTAQRILTALVRPADDAHHIPAVRQQLPLAALREVADPNPGSGEPADHTIDEVLAVLIAHRIVTTRTASSSGQDDSPGVPVAELVHDALIRDWDTLRDWVTLDHRFQDWLHRGRERHTRWATHHDPGDLLHGTDLGEGLDWATHRRLPADIARFLAASRQYQRAGIRRARLLNTILAGLLVAALAATGLALLQRQSAITAGRIALSRQLAVQSAALIDADPDMASLLAIRAYRTSATTEATGSVYAAAGLPLMRRLTGHSNEVLSVSFSPGGRTLATGSDDGTARLWDIATGQPGITLRGNGESVVSVAFSRDEGTLATANASGGVKVWDMASGQPRTTFTPDTVETPLEAFSWDGRNLATADWDPRGGDSTVRVWDVASGQSHTTLTGRTGTVTSVAFSADGRTLATGADRAVRLWDVASGRTRASLPGHTGGVAALAFSPDGRLLAVGDSVGAVRVWEVATGQPRTTLTGHTEGVISVAFSPDGRTLASVGGDGTVRLWDVTSGQLRITLTGPTDGAISVAFSPGGRILAGGGHDGAVRLWDITSAQPRTTRIGNGTDRWRTEFSLDGRTLATVSPGGTVQLWDVASGRTRATLPGHNSGVVEPVAFSWDGRVLATAARDLTGRDAGAIRVRYTAGGQPRTTYVGKADWVTFSPDGDTVASVDIGGAVRVWDVAAGQLRTTLTGHVGDVASMTFSPDGLTLAGLRSDGTVQLWDVATGRPRTALTGHTGQATTVWFSQDARILAVGDSDGAVRLWDAANGQPRTTLTRHTLGANSGAFSPDGHTLATTGFDRTVRVWDVASGRLRTTLTGHTDTVNAVAFGPEGHTIAAAGDDGTMRVWEVALPRPSEAMNKICRAVNRDLTTEERRMYLPPEPSSKAGCR